jgi:hypothetical protein
MKKIAILFVLFLSTPIAVNASYNVGNYDSNYTPYNLQAAIDHGNCEDELKEFDDNYQEIRQRYIDTINGGGMSKAQASAQLNNIGTDFQMNDFESEDAIADCISNTTSKVEQKAKEARQQTREDDREEEIRMAAASCDIEVLEDLTEDEEKKFASRVSPCLDARKKVVVEAVSKCDFSFFENGMTRKERNSWFSERTECEKNPPVTTPEPTSVPVVVPEPIAVDPVVTQYVPPAPPVEVTSVPERVKVEEVTDMSTTTVSEATTTEEIIVSQEELDKMVEERLNEKLEEALVESEPITDSKPSFFKKITNFLFGWMF